MSREVRIKKLLAVLPENPGIYKYFDQDGNILYVGKAKNLKKRVASYFVKKQENHKTRVLVSKIADIQYTVVDTEFDALLLENTLIKELKPRYNINLKDDKSYPMIRITAEVYPRVFPTRNPVKDGSEYFGPYASGRLMHTILELTRALYPTRNCTLNLNEKTISSGQFRVCLEYQIGNCKGPCQGFQSEESYRQSISQIRHILRGNLGEVRRHLRSHIDDAVRRLAFEEAQDYKEKLQMLENYQARSTVVNTKIDRVDVFGMTKGDSAAYFNHLRVANGMIVHSGNLEIRKRIDESDEEMLLNAIAQFLNESANGLDSKEFIVPFLPEIDTDIPFTVPVSGDKKKLLDLSTKNALVMKQEIQSRAEKLDPGLRTDRLMDVMKKDLKLAAQPRHIECFDNSNMQGSYPVSACVVFRNGKPSKKDYRHFNIRTVEGPDDFASMKEVLNRRYTRMLKETGTLPDLVVVDGGKGQLSSAVEAFREMGIYGKVPLIGIAKRLEEIYYPGDSLPLYLDKRSETLKIIQQMRDEAHRFGITHHRNRRSKAFSVTALHDIPGVGEKTSEVLLRKFKSVKKIREAGLDDLKQVIPAGLAEKIYRFFHENN